MNRRDVGLGLVVVTLWGLNFIPIKLGVAEVPPLLLVAMRFLLVAIPAVFFMPRPPIPWKGLIAMSMTLYVAQFGFLFLGIKWGMPAGLASLVHQSQAFFTLLVAVAFLKEKLHWYHLAGLLVATAGMTIIGYEQNTSASALGFWLVLTGSFSWAVGNVIMRKVTLGVPPFSMLSLVVWAGLISFLPTALLSLIIEGFDSWQAAFASMNWVSLASVAYLAYAASLVGYGLWGRLLAKYPATTVAPFSLLVPIVGISSTALFFGEAITLLQGMGSLLVMSGLVLNVFGGRLKKSLKV